ncbi:hypothetical protein ACGF1Z_08220 [Streptomyces sp. NPDC048018]|uniref:hypothetical protein n=1 Tax=Streptomyces sp. NPDC048018 TaxID=3365499 RepID=UPI00370FB206
MRREILPGALVLTGHADRLPALRAEMTDGRRMLVRQGERPVLLARADEDRGGVTVHRRAGYRSPLPPLRAAEARRRPDWLHRFASALEASGRGPLYADRLLLTRRSGFPPYVWRGDFVHDWPTARLEESEGWNGVLPLRRLSAPDAPRVKAYRRLAREGVLPPVLLWWISAFDGWLLLDGHDRAVAALAEGRDPEALVLARGEDEETVAAVQGATAAAFERRPDTLPPGRGPARETPARYCSDALAAAPYDEARTLALPIPGGPAEWDAWMVEFRHEHD